MKNLLREEINQIQYLFGYKKGIVISEQTDPNISKKIGMVQNMKDKETDPNMVAKYDSLIDYYTKLSKDETSKSPDERYTNFIDSKFTTQTPSLPKAEPTTDLGTVSPKTKEEMEDYVNKNPEKYQYAEYSGQLPETQAKSKACLRAGLKFGTGEFKSSPHSIYDRQTKTAYCLVEKLS